jgi:AraC-like DNA-binding protein
VYLGLVRLERARALLHTSAPIAQTAVASGFSDQSHLTRFFKRVYGVTPGAYAKAVRAES